MTSRPDDKAPSYTHFPLLSLDAYRVALEALVQADPLAKKLPRGYGPLSDQLRRASQSAFLQLSEGAKDQGLVIREAKHKDAAFSEEGVAKPIASVAAGV